MNQRYKYIIGSFLTCSVLLQGCNSVKKTLGIDRDAPDEFSVSPSCQPLDMPPEFSVLPTPVPGQPRQQDMKGREATKEKIIGSTQGGRTLTPGQKSILEMAGAEGGKDHVRTEIDNESRIQKAQGKGPVLEQLGIIKKTENKEELINPHTEAVELQNKGVPQMQKAHDEVITSQFPQTQQ